jgi:tetratricopeptide (TPR) repeat protein
MGILDFFKDRKDKKQIDRIIDKVYVHQQAKDFVNKAISYRSINQTNKALEILEMVLVKYPDYRAANPVYGNTLRQAGMIDDAINFFKAIAIKDDGTGIYAPQEIYANLGAIYYFDKNDLQTSLKYYKLALNSPNCPSTDQKGNEIIRSSIHRDLSILYFDQNDFTNSKIYAQKRLVIQKKCPIASKILGLSLINEFLTIDNKLDFFAHKIENVNIIDSIEYLKIALSENSKDYAVLGGLALAYYLLSQMPFYNSDIETEQYINNEREKHLSVLEQDSSVDKKANYYFDMYDDLMSSTATEIIRHKFPNLSISLTPPEKE